MRDFVKLFEEIDGTTKTNQKIQAIVDYLQVAREEDKVFAIAVLTGNKPSRPAKTTDLRLWASELANIPLWLFEESYYIVGDLAESLSLILPKTSAEADYSLEQIITEVVRLKKVTVEEQKEVITGYWNHLSGTSLFVFNKLMTGNFRVGVSSKIVVKALAKYLDKDEAVIEHRLIGKWDPFTETMASLFESNLAEDKHFLPYPFYLAYALEGDPNDLGDLSEWVVEPKLDGIRGQLIVRQNDLFVWSRGEDLMTEKFPEFAKLNQILPDGTVIDGEVIPWKDGHALDFNVMQTRIGRKNLSAKILQEAPLVMVCYDLLEWNGEDIRTKPLYERRALLKAILETYPLDNILILSEHKQFANWEEAKAFRENARVHFAEGLMLKRADSPYEVGRKRGNWYKWKTEPMSIDGVLIYAQSGSGRRANLFTDYTFAVWDQEQLVPFTKAYSGLTDKELITIDNWIKRNTIDKFGPVRSVKPELVFELAFEGINLSTRHKSGVALRFPRILRWRKDKLAKDANTKEDLLDLIKQKP
ncbi:ATP-dependent DNA ligase [Sphingobacterium hungaricum]|uniref:DNA ligase (ATP) n=1 Tax=Sphingobacterium hungaricum TaxID=2082723 RepID=A0A928YS78_9SPHI|nr:ATP-dependent DNA ligase [Sphingobacterium hungaricum]MBE8714960.1 ATP-dependent DNA ligase [Sphingobacterium hungaricum]